MTEAPFSVQLTGIIAANVEEVSALTCAACPLSVLHPAEASMVVAQYAFCR